tara:strand:- start:1106 stop:1366 length:261 start_codon:yes stop_codon:yes gene_type:complete
MTSADETEIDLNYYAFRSQLPSLLRNHAGQYALMHKQKVISFFDNAIDAITEGLSKYGDGGYSIQEVTRDVENLGFYSYAGGALQA